VLGLFKIDYRASERPLVRIEGIFEGFLVLFLEKTPRGYLSICLANYTGYKMRPNHEEVIRMAKNPQVEETKKRSKIKIAAAGLAAVIGTFVVATVVKTRKTANL